MIRYYLLIAISMLALGCPAFGQTMSTGPVFVPVRIAAAPPLHITSVSGPTLLPPVVVTPPPRFDHVEAPERHAIICHQEWFEPRYLYTDSNGRKHYTDGRYVKVCD